MTDDDAGASAELQQRFGCDPGIAFEASPLGGTVAVLRHGESRAMVALQGAQLLAWEPSGLGPALWLSPVARLGTGRAVRGGTPVCWPWFGSVPARVPAGSGPWPQHGLVRTVAWGVVAAGPVDGGVAITLSTTQAGAAGEIWPEPWRATARLTVTLRDTLSLALESENAGATPLHVTGALHTYFRVGDIARVAIDGFDGAVYEDKVPAPGAPTLVQQRGPIGFDREVDRIYRHTGRAVIVDPSLGRRIAVDKGGSASTVVWNPWVDKAERLGDLGTDGHRQMVCVETANTLHDTVRLAAGGHHVLTATYRVERL